MTSYYDVEELEAPRVQRDGNQLVYISMGLAIGGIVIPIVCSIAAIITAGIAKRRLGKGPAVRRQRSIAHTAQAFAVLDMSAYITLVTLLFLGMR